MEAYYYFWGTSPSGNPSSRTTGTEFTAPTGLVNGQDYYFRVRARDNAGNFGSIATFIYKYRVATWNYIPSNPSFIRGDADGNGIFNTLVDMLFLLNAGFIPGTSQPTCLAAADVDGNRTLNFLVDACLD